jgi:hypothetical protein
MKVRENERKCVSIDRRTQTNAKKKTKEREKEKERLNFTMATMVIGVEAEVIYIK